MWQVTALMSLTVTDSVYRYPTERTESLKLKGSKSVSEFSALPILTDLVALMEKVQTQTGDERIQTWMDIERLVLENFIYIPQVYAENNWVFQHNVRGVQIFTYGYEFDFKNVYIVK